jgi:hypothetical protein
MKVLFMLNRTVKLGMKYIFAGLSLIILVAFFHKDLSELFLLSVTEETRIISIGIFSGGIIGGTGVLISAFGFFCQSSTEDRIGMVPTMIITIGLCLIIFVLYLSYFQSNRINSINPEETISI